MGSFKDKIRNNFWGEYLISCYHCLMCKLAPAFVSDEKAVRKFYKKKTGKDLNLNNPKSFSEKMNWYKLNDRNPLMAKCADKVDVREYVSGKGYESCLNEVYGIYDKVSDINLDNLPNRFVIKAAHGSHMVYIVKDKTRFDWKHAKKMMKTWLHQDIYWSGREWVYKDLPKRILIEKYLEDETGELRDYKFFCFHGKPIFMEADIGRYTNHVRNFYDMDFNLIDVSCEFPNDKSIEMVKPLQFEEMKKIAGDLSEPFQHARVDLYLIHNKVFFGEITFFHNSGITWFNPESYDDYFGSFWKIKKEE